MSETTPTLSAVPFDDDAHLQLIERCVLVLVHTDPRLTSKFHRDRLRVLMMDLDPSFNAHRVGEALAHVRVLAQAGGLITHAFRPDAVWTAPSREECLAAFETVSRFFHRGGGTNVARTAERRARSLHLMGVGV
ncbi:MAG: hypothetical protein AAGC76_05330 [Luteibacter sp.]|uniref:hypothetical protein n=1 Tax=Luteibacter sp. TaxID=1886636 RepID=UPI002809D5C4|nr:hypothetical protein [Luteibacter sp.]MDQ7995259.1 hypothetical protein [Luteibacter sp.]